MHDCLNSPHFDADLIGPDGKLTRLHKGGAPAPSPPPPPVRQSNRENAAASKSERKKASQRAGYASTKSKNLLSQGEQAGGKKTLLG